MKTPFSLVQWTFSRPVMYSNKKIERTIKSIYVFIILAFFVLSSTTVLHAQENKTSLRGSSISQTFKKLKENPNNKVLWTNYLAIFPNTKKDFKRIFDPEDFSELYHNSGQYIFILEQAPQNLKEEIIRLIFNITKSGAPGCCDAWSALNMVMENYALNDTSYFITSLKPLKPKERGNVIKFMADKEAIKFSRSYQEIINILNSNNENELAIEFERARNQRIAEPH